MLKLSPYLTGGSLDLSIVDDKGKLFIMGTVFDDLSYKASTRYYEVRQNDNKFNSYEKECLHNSVLIRNLQRNLLPKGCIQLNLFEFIIIPYEAKYAEQTVIMWRESKYAAIGKQESHSFESHVYFLNNILPKEYKIELATVDEKVVGMIAYNKSQISQLYIHIGYQKNGIGKKLLERAKDQSIGRLTLYTFEVNKNAQRFYEKNRFEVIGRGQDNEENLPDIQYEWKAK